MNISPCQSTQYTVPSLIEDHVYEFRVTAENEAGKGTPSEATKPAKVYRIVSNISNIQYIVLFFY